MDAPRAPAEATNRPRSSRPAERVPGPDHNRLLGHVDQPDEAWVVSHRAKMLVVPRKRSVLVSAIQANGLPESVLGVGPAAALSQGARVVVSVEPAVRVQVRGCLRRSNRLRHGDERLCSPVLVLYAPCQAQRSLGVRPGQ